MMLQRMNREFPSGNGGKDSDRPDWTGRRFTFSEWAHEFRNGLLEDGYLTNASFRRFLEELLKRSHLSSLKRKVADTVLRGGSLEDHDLPVLRDLINESPEDVFR